MSTNLADFLLARIAEDERRSSSARTVPSGEMLCICGRKGYIGAHGYDDDRGQYAEVSHIVGWNPPHVDASGYVYDGGGASTMSHTVNGPDFELLQNTWPRPKAAVRAIAECEAKRRIVEQASDAWDASDCTECNEAGYLGDAILSLLALSYADHPDFRDEWRPDTPER